MIEHYSFGTMTIAGKEYRKDLKVVSGRVEPGWWRGEGHLVAELDVEDVLQACPSVLVVGTGANGLMKVADSLCEALERKGIELIAQPSAEAVDTFNRLVSEGGDVAAVFHLTC